MAKKNISDCKLCGQEKKLCRSHIIPEFIFNNIKYKNNKNQNCVLMTSLSDMEDKKETPTGRTKKETTLWKYYFCEDCEKKLSVFENNFKNFFYDKKSIKNSIDIKFFLLSIYWRYSLNKENLRNLDLGETHGKIIKNNILNNENDDDSYKTYIFKLEKWGGLSQPFNDRVEGTWMCGFILEDYLFLTILSDIKVKNDKYIKNGKDIEIIKWRADDYIIKNEKDMNYQTIIKNLIL